MYRNLKESILRSMQSLASALEAKDPYTAGHSQRVRSLSERLAARLSLSQDQLDDLANGCLLHDIGKIGVNRRILNKQEALTEHELEVVRSHAGQGYAIVQHLALGRAAAAIVRHHHERYDGKGYPRGLAGESIPLPVRIVSVCDAFDAMTSDRPYRKGLSVAEALRRLEAGSGSQFDPRMVYEFCAMCREGEADDLIHPQHGERNARLRAV
jgi:HD-GYP domain-containing protein (c-di-GMP phosphodiesterase class II)